MALTVSPDNRNISLVVNSNQVNLDSVAVSIQNPWYRVEPVRYEISVPLAQAHTIFDPHDDKCFGEDWSSFIGEQRKGLGESVLTTYVDRIRGILGHDQDVQIEWELTGFNFVIQVDDAIKLLGHAIPFIPGGHPKRTIEQILEAMLARPAMYVGIISLPRIHAYMQGYLYGIGFSSPIGDMSSYQGFDAWVQKRLAVTPARNWARTISFVYHDDNQAFEKMKELWAEYRTECAVRWVPELIPRQLMSDDLAPAAGDEEIPESKPSAVELFEDLLLRPEAYVDHKSLTSVRLFLSGYRHGAEFPVDLESVDLLFEFHRFVAQRFHIKLSLGWDSIISVISGSADSSFELAQDLWYQHKSQQELQLPPGTDMENWV